jgi:hypothetical protein
MSMLLVCSFFEVNVAGDGTMSTGRGISYIRVLHIKMIGRTGWSG